MPATSTTLADSIRDAIRTHEPSAIVAEHVLERVPHLFGDDWKLYRQWRLELASRIGVDPCDIALTGSASVGVSLSPYKNLSQFNAESDVDVAVISGHHFDVAWRALRGFRLGNALNQRERQAVRDHQQKYIYFGCIASDRILRLMPFATEWTIAISHMRGIAPTEGRDINFRIYRDYESLRSYQVRGVRAIRTDLLETK